MKKKQYIVPCMEFIAFDTEDVIMTSSDVLEPTTGGKNDTPFVPVSQSLLTPQDL